MSMTRMYLDVDGVINGWAPQDAGWPDKTEARACPEDGHHKFRIVWSPTLLKELAALGVDITWATTWQGSARTVLAPLFDGFGANFPNLTHPPRKMGDHSPSIAWKRTAVIDAQLVQNDPFIWVDDELPDLTEGYLQPLPDWIAPHLIIAPDANTGISVAQVQEMKDFLKEIS